MIVTENLVKDFGTRRAVDGITFTVEPGTVLGFLGPNGAGKTTTIRMLVGYLRPTSGRAVVMDVDVTRDPVAAQHKIGYLPENAPLYDNMTVEEFLSFVADARGFSGKEKRDRINDTISRCFLDPVRHQPVDTLSKGYRQRTCFAQAILHDPPVLLLDEPTEGLDPNQKQVVREMIRSMGREKIIMLSTHVLEEVESVCSRVIIISKGKIVADDTPAGLKKLSPSYNTVTLTLQAPEKDARAAFTALADVHAVTTIASRDGALTLRVEPREQRPIAAALLEAARSHAWPVIDLQTDPGRLDEVFRRITTTEDTSMKTLGRENAA